MRGKRVSHRGSHVSHFFARPLVFFLFFPIAILYMELVLKVYCFGTFFTWGLLYTLLFSVPLGLICALLCSFFSPKANRIISYVLIILLTLAHCIQTVYFTIFKTFLVLYSFTATGEVMQYWKEMLAGIWSSLPILILLALPLVFWLVFGKSILLRRRPAPAAGILLVGAIVVLQLVATLAVYVSNQGILSVRYLYTDSFVPDLMVSNFGVMTTFRLDAKNLIFGANSEEVSNTPVNPSASPGSEPTSVSYPDNVLDIDFGALAAGETNNTLKDMHTYFASVTPTKQNKYTDLWKGKNLIWICAEGFSSYAVNKDLTPTLYKLANEGFVFKNFYNPIWGVSTSDGEYTTCTSLIPKSGIRSFARSGQNYMPFCLGNQLSGLGYKTLAYHNHTYSFYGRDKSHPNMGYTYKGVGNGLEVRKTWPESDVEMINVTVPEYINNQPFHTYYMTVSGHLLYSFSGNYIANKNKDLVADMPYSEAVKAYLACNIELDRALQTLLADLESAGILENTAIVLSGDHYPYGLEWEGLDAINEIAGHTVERNFELYKTTLIMWSGDMKTPVTVEKPCCPLDILPTISNLMGIPYDSRLLMGSDIFSDAPGLIIFSNRSWITDSGRYNTKTGEFTPNEGVTVDDGYARSIMKVVNQKFSYSAKVLENNYYKVAVPRSSS